LRDREHTVAAPNGDPYVGKAACLHGGALSQIVERALTNIWGADRTIPIRGVSFVRVRDTLIVKALGYAKGAN
jgi:hypothetical protein